MWAGPAVGFVLGAALAAPAVWLWLRRAARSATTRAREAEDRVHNAERLAYVGQLAGGLAHEIKNPLSTLSLNLQLLAEDWEEGGGARDARAMRRIETLQRESERLAGVLDDFLRFARGHDLNLVPGDLFAVVAEVLDFFAPEAEQDGVDVRRDLKPLPRVALDADTIKQALFNIVLNAQQAMPEGGQIFVQTAARNGDVFVHITDTGCGIPREEREAIFRPYHSTKQGGTGLGLPTSRRIVEEHGGSLRVESEVGKGSRFTLRLPALPEDEEPAP